MNSPLTGYDPTGAPAPRAYGLPMTESVGVPHPDAASISFELIHDVVIEFYLRARRDEMLGPVFDKYVHDWDVHLDRMTDFWSAALLRSGRYSGRPVERHRPIAELTAAHFQRWIELFEETTRDLCTPQQAGAFILRAWRMREGMTKVLRLDV